jgi:tetratricopeptide (TPR) repeat protein
VQRHDYEKAISYLQKGVEVDPRSVNNRIALADVQLEMGEPGRAEATLLEALEIDPGHARTYEELSDLHTSRGQFGEALRYTMKALERDPTDIGALLDACWGYLNLDDIESAKKWSRRLERDQRSEIGGLVAQLQLAAYDHDRDAVRRLIGKLAEEIHAFVTTRRVFVYTMDRDYDAARTALEVNVPSIFRDDFKPAFGQRNQATLACFVLKAQGQTRELNRRIADLEALVSNVPEKVRVREYQLDVVNIHVLRGQLDEALDAYEVAVANGRTNRWWDHENFAGQALKNEPRFGQIIEGIRADVAEQRAALAAEGLANP